jgi:predicted ABC-type ATPase
MSTPRLRMIAGPNGSGKSTLFDYLRTKTTFPLGHCLNPDVVERQLVESGTLAFDDWNLRVDEGELASFVQAHGLSAKISRRDVSVRDNVLVAPPDVRGGYFAAVLSDFMRRQWIATGQTFAFETVMSGGDKVDLLREAVGKGYRTYLYYICTDSPIINRERVASRVLQGGHGVPEDKIDARYRRSLGLLPAAVRESSRAYLFDNSGDAHRLIAEFDGGKLVAVSESLPGWFVGTQLLDVAGGVALMS